jgi:solute carrier family 25 ornithine transporter 2/15
MNLLELFQPPPGFGETRCVHPLSKKIYRWIGEWIEVVLLSLTHISLLSLTISLLLS